MAGNRNTILENIILANPGMSVKDLCRLSGLGKWHVTIVKRKLKKQSPESFGLEKRYPVNENSLNEVAELVVEGMSPGEKRAYISGIVNDLLSKNRITVDDVEELGYM